VPFFGMPVARGRVVYVAAEGFGGLGVRVVAWKQSNERYGKAGVYFLPEPVHLLDETQREVGELIAAIRAIGEPVRLIVLDTLAWCTVGGKENAAEVMGLAVAGMRRLRDEIGAAVLVLHHTTKDNGAERGSTSLRGNVDMMMSLSRSGDNVTVKCEKQKDAAKFADFTVQLVDVGDSKVLITAEGPAAVIEPLRMPEAIQALRSLQNCAPLEEGLPTTRWKEVSGLKDRTFYEKRTALIAAGYVEGESKKRGAPNRLTEKGKAAVTANCNITA